MATPSGGFLLALATWPGTPYLRRPGSAYCRTPGPGGVPGALVPDPHRQLFVDARVVRHTEWIDFQESEILRALQEGGAIVVAHEESHTGHGVRASVGPKIDYWNCWPDRRALRSWN